MSLWLVRAGKYGDQESLALDRNVAVIGFDSVPDMANYASRAAVDALVRQSHPDGNPNAIAQWVGQVWKFRGEIAKDDLVALPLKTRSAVAIGRVIGPYQFRSDFPDGAHHTIPVQWLRTDIPRTAISPDILNSLGSTLTVCRIERNDAERRIRALLNGGSGELATTTQDPEVPEEGSGEIDVEQYAADQIRTYIGQHFRGHGFARLVNQILEAQGYKTFVSPEGADGGVDIMAGRGPMGFDPPRLAVQVKATNDPIDVKPLRELQGVMNSHGADQALLVSWGGFKDSVRREARALYFKVRLWDADDVVNALLGVYETLPDETQAELPLKRVWALVPE